MPVSNVRNFTEYPARAEVGGNTVFDLNAMTLLIGTDTIGYQSAEAGNVTTVTTTYQAQAADGLVLAGNTTSYTVTLPTVAQGVTIATSGVPKGKVIRVKKTGASGTLTVAGSGSETIDGSANVTTSTQNDVIMLMCDGTNWRRINLVGSAAQAKKTVTTQTTTANMATTDDVTLATTNTTYTLTLPAPAGLTGVSFIVKKTGVVANQITVTHNAAETIDGATSVVLTEQYETAHFMSDGTNWQRTDQSRFTPAVQVVTNTATLALGQSLVTCTGTNSYVLTLPSAASAAGRTYFFKKTGASGTITITPAAGNIDGSATKPLATQYGQIILFSDGTQWWEITGAVPTAGSL